MRFDYRIGAYNDSTSWCGLLWRDLGTSFVKIKESPEEKKNWMDIIWHHGCHANPKSILVCVIVYNLTLSLTNYRRWSSWGKFKNLLPLCSWISENLNGFVFTLPDPLKANANARFSFVIANHQYFCGVWRLAFIVYIFGSQSYFLSVESCPTDFSRPRKLLEHLVQGFLRVSSLRI